MIWFERNVGYCNIGLSSCKSKIDHENNIIKSARPIRPYNHCFLLAAPAIFGMETTLCTLTYVLAGVHFALTTLTAFQVGLVKVIPFGIHGLLVVAIALGGVASWITSNKNDLSFIFI